MEAPETVFSEKCSTPSPPNITYAQKYKHSLLKNSIAIDVTMTIAILTMTTTSTVVGSDSSPCLHFVHLRGPIKLQVPWQVMKSTKFGVKECRLGCEVHQI